ncbi:carph-isopro domain-containing protein [Novosphingobium sp. GV055]|uniref:carph-isopro domain-containing protein n=1 Tax=unclassified Novosphingobium TaxID=2644732 RepID=UPI0035114B79
MIAALGGTVEVAKAIQAPPSTVSSWKTAGKIPRWRMAEIERLAKDKGVSLAAQAAP